MQTVVRRSTIPVLRAHVSPSCGQDDLVPPARTGGPKRRFRILDSWVKCLQCSRISTPLEQFPTQIGILRIVELVSWKGLMVSQFSPPKMILVRKFPAKDGRVSDFTTKVDLLGHISPEVAQPPVKYQSGHGPHIGFGLNPDQ